MFNDINYMQIYTIKRITASLFLLLWWFAAIDQQGQTLIFEYRDKAQCEAVQRSYERLGIIKTTVCQTIAQART